MTTSSSIPCYFTFRVDGKKWDYEPFDRLCEEVFGPDNFPGSLLAFGEQILTDVVQPHSHFYHYLALTPGAALWLQLNMPSVGEVVDPPEYFLKKLQEVSGHWPNGDFDPPDDDDD